MNVENFVVTNDNFDLEKYDKLFNEYKDKVNRLIPLGEKYILNEECTILNVVYNAGTTFVIDLAYAPSIYRIDLVLCIGENCVVYDDVDSLLGVLEDLNFDVFKQDVITKLDFLEEETMKLFKMIGSNDVELLLQLKDGFKKLKAHSNSADYKVIIKK